MTGIAAGAGALTGAALGWWGAAAVAAAAMAYLLAAGRDRIVVAVCLIAVVAAVAGAWRSTARVAPTGSGVVVDLRDPGTVAAAPIIAGQRQHLVVAFGDSDDRGGVARRVCVTAGVFPQVGVGDKVRVRGGLREARDVALAHRAFLASRGCGSSMFAESMTVIESRSSLARGLADVRSRLGEALRLAAPGDAGVLLSGLVTGDDAGFSRARQEAFNSTGTTHLTAVSGSNLALVAGMLAAIGGATVGRRRAGWQIVTVGGVWAYAAISGAEAPALRAAIVASAAILAFRFGRRPDFVTLVVLAAGAMALLDPGRVESLGFRLSIAASLALALVLPTLMARGRGAGVAAVVAATAAAQIATLPFLLPVFGAVSLTSVPANIIAAPLAAVAMPLAGLAGLAGLLWQPMAEPLAAPAILAANALIAAVDHLGAPGAYVRVGAPPLMATIASAAMAAALLAALARSPKIGKERLHLRPRATEESTLKALPAPATLVFARENPAHALGAHLDDAKKNPAGEEDGHEVADVRNLPKAVP